MNTSMKKLALGLLSLFLVLGSMNAQEGKKALKKGTKLLAKYGQNAVANEAELSEGLALLETAFTDPEVTAEAKNYNALGAAYTEAASAQVNAKLIDPTYELANADLAVKALDAYVKAHGMAEKKGDKNDALAGIKTVENVINNIAIYNFQESKYGEAFTYFSSAIEAYKALSANGGESRLDDEVERKDHYFYTGVSGYYGEKGVEAAPVLEELVGMGTDKGLVYEALYNIYATTDKEKAAGFLNKGRELFPDDTGLLFAEINYYLTEGKLDVLTGKLKTAIEKEPENVTLYTTTGNVFDQLNQKERAAGNTAKADEYFDEALNYYSQAIAKDPANFDAVYSQGALYYNKAASLTGAINELANDFSAAGTKKYDALKLTMDGYFNEALPYFKKAETMNGDDLNTLIALKEIHARKNEMDSVATYKAKIDALQAGN